MSDHPVGTALRGPDGQVAVRMDSPAGTYFVVTAGGGFWVRHADVIATIDGWKRLVEETADGTAPA